MFGLEFISVGLMHLIALDTKPLANQIGCTPTKPLFVDVVLAQEDVQYDFSKKTAELNRIGKGAYSPYGEGHLNTEFQGLTVGKQSLNHNIKFYFEKNSHHGLACLQIEKIKVVMNYAPTIYISIKFKKGTPIFNKILEHEEEHVHITQSAIKKYANILKGRLVNGLKGGFSIGPFPIDSDMMQEQKILQDKVQRITRAVEYEMHKYARKQHNLFDDAELDDTINYNQGIAKKLERILKINE